MQDGTGMAGSPGDPGSVDAGPPSSGRQGALRGRRALGLHHQTLGPGTEINQFFFTYFSFQFIFSNLFFYGVIYMRIISLTDFFLHSSPLWSVTPVLGLD